MSGKTQVEIEVTARTGPAQADMTKLAVATNKAKTAAEGAAASMGRVSKSASGLGAQLSGAANNIAATAAAMGPLGLAGAVVGAVAAVDKLSQRSLALRDVQGALRISIDKARAASNGLIGDYDLQTAAVTALRFGIVKTDADFAKLVKTATLLARTTGQDSTQAVQDLTTALSRQSPMILDNLGLQVSVEKANREYAASLGKSAAQLTDIEKKQAFFNAAMADAERKTNNITVATDGWAVSLQQLKVSLGNVLDDVVQLPENIAALGSELQNAIGISDEAAESYAMVARVGLAAITLGGSEAIIQLRELHRVMTEVPGVLGDRQGHGLFAGFENVGKNAAQRKVNEQAAGEGVLAGLANSLSAGQTALEKYEKAHRKAAQATKEDSEALRAFKSQIEQFRNLAGVTRAGADTRDFESMRVSAHNEQVANDAINSGALSRDGKTPEERERARLKAIDDARAEFERNQKERHEAEMKRQEELLAKQEAVGAAIGGSLASVAATALQAGDLSAAGFKRVLAAWGKTESIRLAALAISEGVQAVVSAAFFNFPQAALHGAAAAQAAAGAVVVAGMTGAVGGFSSISKKVSGGFTGADFGAGSSSGAANGPVTPSNSQADTVPVSPQEAAQHSGAGRSSRGTSVHIGTIQVLGAIDNTSARKISDAIRRAQRSGDIKAAS